MRRSGKDASIGQIDTPRGLGGRSIRSRHVGCTRAHMMKSACGAAGALLSLVACGGTALTREELVREQGPRGAGSLAAPADSAEAAPAALCSPRPSSPMSELWRHDFGDSDVTQPSSVAADVMGNAFFALATGKTVKVDESGNVQWSNPFGALVATDG